MTSPPSTHSDDRGLQKELLARDAEWSALASAGQDLERILSFWADDAVVVPPGQPLMEGKEAIRAFVVSSLGIPGFSIRWTSDSVTFSPDRRMAYMQARNVCTLPDANGSLLTLHGRAVTIWRIDHDEQWRCVVDIWNDAPTAT